jgi:hypothetical protein
MQDQFSGIIKANKIFFIQQNHFGIILSKLRTMNYPGLQAWAEEQAVCQGFSPK